MTTEQLTLYTAKICPYAHRTEIALAEAKAEFTRYEIDLSDKPEWFAPKVNPASKVPAIAYGGPKVPADSPSPDSIKLAESLVLVELIADLYPDSNLLPKDPIQRAKARYFIELFAGSFTSAVFTSLLGRGPRNENGPQKSLDYILDGFEEFQKLLPAEAKYAIGDEFSIADVAIVPFLARSLLILETDIGPYDAGLGKKTYETLHTDPKYARVKKYLDDVRSRESFKTTFDKDTVKEQLIKRTGWERC